MWGLLKTRVSLCTDRTPLRFPLRALARVPISAISHRSHDAEPKVRNKDFCILVIKLAVFMPQQKCEESCRWLFALIGGSTT